MEALFRGNGGLFRPVVACDDRRVACMGYTVGSQRYTACLSVSVGVSISNSNPKPRIQPSIPPALPFSHVAHKAGDDGMMEWPEGTAEGVLVLPHGRPWPEEKPRHGRFRFYFCFVFDFLFLRFPVTRISSEKGVDTLNVAATTSSS